MVEGLEIRELTVHEDQRGWLVEILRDDESDYTPVMSYLSMTRSGLLRGPHEHREQTDCFCFVGNFRLYVWDNRKDSSTYLEKKVIDTKGIPTMAIVPAGIVHAYKNIGSSDGLVINMPDRLFMGEGKAEPVDEIRHEDDPSSPFQIED
ncbi:MAG TPA: dTDP-4-dehydrorhamnose 3,5-epimerase [Nitrospirae bacterium]|nr:dTDP-4-dehydrorhamnose 3,5-epimerase [Nitrospirota bacterium]